VRKAADHTPIAYLTGRKEFYSLDFRVSPSVLIPRPETESLVENVIRHAESPSRGERPLRICDVGTGSGCIAVALAKHLPACKITAVDVSPSALALARENAVAHDVSNRVRFARADVMSGLNGPYDIVAANPPYIRTDELESLPPSVRDHEPRIALIGGDDGLEVIRSIVRQSAELLAPGGSLYVEIGHAQADEVIGSMIDVGPWSNVDCVKDLLGVRRIIVAERRWEPGESHGLLRH
jgi:release factor glutamine methyltransferase